MDKFKGIFIKIGEYQHLKSLQSEGLLHCETLQYFAKLKDEQGKGDELENVVDMQYYGNAKMHILYEKKNQSEILSFDVSDLRKYKRIVSHCGNLFCMYSFNITDLPFNQPQKFNIDSKLGTHALIIKSDLFFQKLKIELDKLDYYFNADFVEYIDFSKYSGYKTFFQKDISFAKQKEYRILIESEESKILQLKIGNIEDITDLISIEELLNMTMVRPDENLQKSYSGEFKQRIN